MIARATLVGALAAGCALIGCQEPPDSITERTDPVEHVQVAAECLETCGNDAQQSLERCREARTDEAVCIDRNRTNLAACQRTCNAPCPTLPPPIPTAPPPPPITPCEMSCVLTLFETNQRCNAEGAEASLCRFRAQKAFDACLLACHSPPPAP